MPSSTPKQARFMAAAAHDPKFAKRVGVPHSVAKEYNEADTGTEMLSEAMTEKRKRRQMGLAAALRSRR